MAPAAWPRRRLLALSIALCIQCIQGFDCGQEIFVKDSYGGEHVELGDCRELLGGCDAARAALLAEALKVNTGLQTLSFYGCLDTGDAYATALAEALKVNTGLQTLTFSGSDLHDAGATALAEALKVNTGLQTLFFYGSYLHDAGATALAEALKVNTGLQTLWLGTNGIGDTGAAALAEALKVNTRLQTLYLRENGIGDTGAAALAEALKVNTGLQKLNLGGNQITDAGAAALAEALKVNIGLQTLNLEGNQITDAGAAALAEAVRVNSALTKLDVDDSYRTVGGGDAHIDNPISDAAQEALDAALRAPPPPPSTLPSTLPPPTTTLAPTTSTPAPTTTLAPTTSTPAPTTTLAPTTSTPASTTTSAPTISTLPASTISAPTTPIPPPSAASALTDCPRHCALWWTPRAVSITCVVFACLFLIGMFAYAVMAPEPPSGYIGLEERAAVDPAATPFDWIELPWHAVWDSVDANTFATWAYVVLGSVPYDQRAPFAVMMAFMAGFGVFLPIWGNRRWSQTKTPEQRRAVRAKYRIAQFSYDLLQISLVVGSWAGRKFGAELPLCCPIPISVVWANSLTTTVDILMFKGPDWLLDK